MLLHIIPKHPGGFYLPVHLWVDRLPIDVQVGKIGGGCNTRFGQACPTSTYGDHGIKVTWTTQKKWISTGNRDFVEVQPA